MLLAIEQGNTCTVIPTIFQSLQTLYNNVVGLFISDVGNNSAHIKTIF